MNRHRASQAGFSLIELSVVCLIFGVMLAFSIPSFISFRRTHLLKGATENLVGQLRLSRQKAMSIGHQQRVTFTTGANGSYIVRDMSTSKDYGPFTLPKGITLESASLLVGGTTGKVITALTDGRFSGSGDVVLKDPRGLRDTVSVQTSGLALSH
ncbi:MAG TPA: prepilin-type N-terminal cleavage/methylation domain-containing protein [Candidatus Eisenbacteria bacterium]|jgi:prepilin-type N-terminal cleavage/methylation domain-containing protein